MQQFACCKGTSSSIAKGCVAHSHPQARSLAASSPAPRTPSLQFQSRPGYAKVGTCISSCCQPTARQSSRALAQHGDQAQAPANAWQTHLSSKTDFAEALEEVIAGCTGRLGSEQPHLALIFVSSAFADQYHQIVPELRRRVPSLAEVVGCSGFGVIGNDTAGPQEIERSPAISLTLASLPGVEVRTTLFTRANVPDADASPMVWQDVVGVPIDTPKDVSFVLMSEVTYGEIAEVIAGLDYAYPEAVKLGGLCAAANGSAKRTLIWWSACPDAQNFENGLVEDGCLALVLHGNVVIEPIIAQGCKAVSTHTWIVEEVKARHWAMQLSRAGPSGRRLTRTPLQALEEELHSLPADTRQQALRSLIMGVAPDDFKDSEKLGPQDFLTRGIIGLEQSSGAMGIAETLRKGQRLQFMIRSREGAMSDMQTRCSSFTRSRLEASMAGKEQQPPFGALIFSCNGRGMGLYDTAAFDSRTLASYVPVPSAGFFCNGELGQVGRSTYLHGFTAAIGVLRPSDPET